MAAPTRRDKGRIPYLPGLDGLRAVAVLAVLAYHADLTLNGIRLFGGGFLGVEVFFVISGYLITSILLRQSRARGGIDLRTFYRNRARRLLPALFVTLVAVVVAALALAPAEVAGLRGDVVASLAYVTNWFFIFGDKPYFEVVGRPSLLQHLWSLAVEEQFYIVWPLVFAGGLRLFGRTRTAVATAVGAVASAVLMAVLHARGTDVTRLYEGTDTRAAGLLVGAALAFVWAPQRLRAEVGRGARPLLDAVGAAAGAVLLLLLLVTDQFSEAIYRFGFFGVSIVTALLIAVVVHPAAHIGPLLGSPALRWIGQRSYGIYLYHWPVFQFTRPQLDVPLTGLPLLVLRIAATIVVAQVSFRFVEVPIRRDGWGRVCRRVADALSWWQRCLGLPPVTTGVASAVVVLVLVAAVVRAQPPEVPAYLRIEATASGPPPVARALPPVRSASRFPAPDATTTTSPVGGPVAVDGPTPTTPSGDPAATGDETTVSSATPETTAAPLPPPPRTPPSYPPLPPELAAVAPTDRQIVALGDSVMLGAAATMSADLAGSVFVDAAVGRQVSDCLDLLRVWRDENRLGAIVIVHFGNNGTFRPGQFDELIEILAGVPRVVVVNDKIPRSWEGYNNDVIADGMTRFPNAVLVDWKGATDPRPELFWEDGMHLRPEGSQLYVEMLAEAM